MKNKTIFARAILAGLMIGISATVYLSCENKVIGAFLFTLGLLSICTLNLYLFTGKIGYIFTENKNYTGHLLTWIGNLIGSVLCGIMIRYVKPELILKARHIITEKFSMDIGQSFVLGIFCGILMYVAVQIYNSTYDSVGKYMGIMLCIPTFILSGFEHSIADMFYSSIGICSLRTFVTAILFILIVTLGNAIGSIIFDVVLNLRWRRNIG